MVKKLLMGNEAMAHAALEAGVRVVAGYPGTPSSEIVETVAKLRASGAAQGVHVEWSTNEKAALEVLFGASLAGARGLFTCKQMGLNVASDALMSLNYVSVRGGLVLVVADDPGPISSQTEQDTRRFAAFAKVPVLDPSTPEQAFDMVKAAFELSERFHTPVIVRPTTRVDHASAFFEVQEQTQALPVPDDGFQRDVAKWVIFPRRAYEAHGEINERLPQIAHAFATEDVFAPFNKVNNIAGDCPSLGIVAGGISAAYAREALRMVQQRAAVAGVAMPACRFMQVGTPYPFPEQAVADFAAGLGDVLVLEELDYVLEDELTRWVGRTHSSLNVHGKLTGEARDRGENDLDDIVARIERFLGLSGRLRLARRGAHAAGDAAAIKPESLPARPPVLCPGCPHRGAFYAVKQALRGVPAVMCGDIGCYTLGNAKPLDAVDTCLCMGAGITMAQGFSIADPDKKAIAYVGDSTFFASGMTGLANAAYNGHDITVMVLDNATTAMTGSQPHPGTGITLMGQRNEPLDIEAVLVANGFAHVFHVDPLDKDAAIVAVKAAVFHEGPAAVIFESPCIQLIEPDEPLTINVDVCTGCKKCITEIGCPAVGFDTTREGIRSGGRGQAVIDTALCNGCGLCAQVCPFKAIEVPPLKFDAGVQPTVAIDAVEVPALDEREQGCAGLDGHQPEQPSEWVAGDVADGGDANGAAGMVDAAAASAMGSVDVVGQPASADAAAEAAADATADAGQPEGEAPDGKPASGSRPFGGARPPISMPSFNLSKAKMAEAAKAAAAKVADVLVINSSVESAAARIAKVPVVESPADIPNFSGGFDDEGYGDEGYGDAGYGDVDYADYGDYENYEDAGYDGAGYEGHDDADYDGHDGADRDDANYEDGYEDDYEDGYEGAFVEDEALSAAETVALDPIEVQELAQAAASGVAEAAEAAEAADIAEATEADAAETTSEEGGLDA